MSLTSRDADDTYLVWGGIIIAIVVIIGLFALHYTTPDKSLLSPEIVMAMIAIPSAMFSYAMGKKKNNESNGNGNKTQ